MTNPEVGTYLKEVAQPILAYPGGGAHVEVLFTGVVTRHQVVHSEVKYRPRSRGSLLTL